MSTLIAEDLLLLLLHDESGKLFPSNGDIRLLLSGALLSELALAERIKVAEKANWWNIAKVAVIDGPPVDDPLLAEALDTVAEKPRGPKELVIRLGKGTKDVLLERLSRRGLVQPVEDKVLGLFPRTTWPATERTHEAAIQGSLQGALVLGLTADARTCAMISLLSAIDHAQYCVVRGDLPVREIQRRAKDIRDGDWVGTAVEFVVTMNDGMD